MSHALSPAFQPGRPDLRTTLVLAAPGLLEKEAGRPAAGRTGKVLDALLARLHQGDPISFPFTSRLDYRIVNSVDMIMSGRKSLPTKWQIRDPANVARLRDQLAGSEVVVAFGPHAFTAVAAAGMRATFVSGHPGLKGVNQLPLKVRGSGAQNMEARLDLFACLLLASRRSPEIALEELKVLRRSARAGRSSA